MANELFWFKSFRFELECESVDNMNMLNRFIAYHKDMASLIRNNQDEIDESNQKLTFVMLTMGCICYLFFIGVSLLLQHYRPLLVPYVMELTILCFLSFLFPAIVNQVPSAFFIYIGYGTLIGFSIYTSAFVTPNYTSVVILLFLSQIPIITLDKSWRINLIVILYSVIYMVVVIPYKDPRLISDEIFNCLLTVSIALVLGEFLRRARLENFELKRQALLREKTDFITGLFNRSSLYDYLMELQQTTPEEALGIVMMDIDYFKKYNDTYGHQAGDVCIKKVGEILLQYSQRVHIQFFRYGGEEFVGIAKGYSSEELFQICDKIRNEVYQLRIPNHAMEGSFVTISIGISPVCQSADVADLLHKADETLYAAKASGRNRVMVYREDLNRRILLSK